MELGHAGTVEQGGHSSVRGEGDCIGVIASNGSSKVKVETGAHGIVVVV